MPLMEFPPIMPTSKPIRPTVSTMVNPAISPATNRWSDQGGFRRKSATILPGSIPSAPERADFFFSAQEPTSWSC
jgi:hypothetical protein